MNLTKCIATILSVMIGAVNADFQQNIKYILFVPTYSTWGVFKTQNVSGSALAQNAGVDLLQKCSIDNNMGKKGTLTGSMSEFQLVPSLLQGVEYWNPLSIINSIQPCLLESFIANNNQLPSNCSAPEVLMIDKSSIIPTQKSNVSSSILTQRYQALMAEKENAFLKDYQSLYSLVEQDLNTMIAIKQAMTNNSNFYSTLYLKFAATYGNQFINKAQLQQAQSTLFGSDTDISTYFKDGIFPVVCDLTVSNKERLIGANSTTSFLTVSNGGPFVRAAQIDNLDASKINVENIINQIPLLNFSQIITFLNNASDSFVASNSIYNRARVTELFFLYLGILMGSNMIAGAPTYDESFCSDTSCPGNGWCPIPSPCEKMNTIPFSFYSSGSHYCFAQVCSKLAAAARYVSFLHDINSQRATSYTVQPVDRWYGMIVLNQSSYTITSNDVAIAPGQVGMLKAPPGVDIWDVQGVDIESNYKYRSLLCNLFKGNDVQSIELRVTENFEKSQYTPAQIYIPPITLYNHTTKLQQDIVATEYLQSFFNFDPATGWAVVVQIAEEPNTIGTFNLALRMVGIARLNSYDFPLVYRGPGLEQVSVGPFSAAQLWQAPFLVYTKIVAGQSSNKNWTLCSTDTPPSLLPLAPVQLNSFTISIPTSTSTKTITPDPINPYYIAYKSALGYTFGSKNSLQQVLQNTLGILKKLHFTAEDLAVSPLISLIKKASMDAASTIVQISITEDYRLAS